MTRYLFTLGIILSLLIRGSFILSGKHVADIWHIARMGEVFLQGLNPFLTLDFNVYPPGAVLISAATIKLYEFLNLPFHVVIKFWPNLADLITAFIIYKFLIKTKVKALNAVFWSLVFLLNPISIIISSAHGQLDSITTMFVLLAVFFLTFYSSARFYFLSAFLLGLAIIIKPNPVILIPLILFFKKAKFLQRFNFLSIIFLTIGISLIPFLLQNPLQVLNGLISYSGVYDFSYAAILRGIWYQINAAPYLPSELMDEMFRGSKLSFIIGSITLMVLFASWKQLSKVILAVYLLFFSFYFGIGAQYLSWIIVFACLAREKMLIFYTFFGSIALLGFYLFFGPDLLLGKFATELPFDRKYMYLYFYGNFALWITCLGWLVKIVTEYLKISFSGLGVIRKGIVISAFVIFTVSLLPMFNLIMKFFKLYAQDN